MGFLLTQKAKQDLKNIARYTDAEWGREQRNLYLKQFDKTFHQLAEAPGIGINCDYLKAHYRKYKVGRHYVFYKPYDEKTILITRILHERMNVETHL